MEELSPAGKAYVRVTVVAMTLYSLLLVGWAATAWLDVKASRSVVLAMVALTSVALVVHMWSVLRLVQRSDEFMRTVMAKRLLTAAMIAIGCATLWGLLQTIGWVSAFPLPLLYMLFLVVHAALSPFINADRP